MKNPVIQNNAPEYSIWRAIRNKCDNPKNAKYQSHGGRGIKYDPAWSAFEKFLADVGNRPSCDSQLRRINLDYDFSESNCRWFSADELTDFRGLGRYQIRDNDEITKDQACQGFIDDNNLDVDFYEFRDNQFSEFLRTLSERQFQESLRGER